MKRCWMSAASSLSSTLWSMQGEAIHWRIRDQSLKLCCQSPSQLRSTLPVLHSYLKCQRVMDSSPPLCLWTWHKALKAPQSWAENWSLNCNWLVSADLLKNTSCNSGVSYITTHPTNMKTSFQPTSLTGWTRSCSGMFVLLSISFWQLAARDITVLSFCSLTISEEHINQQSTQQHNAFPVVTSYSIKMCFTT